MYSVSTSLMPPKCLRATFLLTYATTLDLVYGYSCKQRHQRCHLLSGTGCPDCQGNGITKTLRCVCSYNLCLVEQIVCRRDNMMFRNNALVLWSLAVNRSPSPVTVCIAPTVKSHGCVWEECRSQSTKHSTFRRVNLSTAKQAASSVQ